jgi:hypothetical protein
VDYTQLIHGYDGGPVIATAAWQSSPAFFRERAAVFYRNGSKSTESAVSAYDVLYYSAR